MGKKILALVLAVSLLLTMSVFASVNITPSSGWDITSGGGYRYGPSIIINPDKSIDLWMAAPGSQSGTDLYNLSKASSPFQLSKAKSAAEKFHCDETIDTIGVAMPTWSTTTSSAHLNFYKWKTNYATTVAQTPLYSKTYANVTDGSRLLAYNGGGTNELPAGDYLWVATYVSGKIGIWQQPDNLPGNTAFINGKTGTGKTYGDFQTVLNGYGGWDCIKYMHSTDGGKTWTKQATAVHPTAGSDDSLSTCDPGVFYHNGYYYVGYTSIPHNKVNDVFIARSKSPTGPFEKWNGSGWGGNPKPMITYTDTGSGSTFGAGEPSFVVKGGTIYTYYTWTTADASGNQVGQLRVATASASDPDWPASLSYQGVAITRTNNNSDSFDVKYIDAYGKFIAVQTAQRMAADSYIQAYESTDGIRFVPSDMVINASLASGAHNIGISGTADGHMDINDSSFIAYAHGKGGNTSTWQLHLNPITFTNDDLFGAPTIYSTSAGGNSLIINYLTIPGAASYLVRYGPSSGNYTDSLSTTGAGTCVIPNLLGGQTYYYTIAAVDKNGSTGHFSKECSASPSSGPFEFENFTLAGGVKANNNHKNFSGTGFADTWDAEGASATLTATSASAQTYHMTVGYAEGAGSQTLSLYVNGVKKQLTFPQVAAGNWDKWGNIQIPITVKAGDNIIQFKFDSGDTGHLNLDYLLLTEASSSTGTPGIPSGRTKTTEPQSSLNSLKTAFVTAGTIKQSNYTAESWAAVNPQLQDDRNIASGLTLNGLCTVLKNDTSVAFQGGTMMMGVKDKKRAGESQTTIDYISKGNGTCQLYNFITKNYIVADENLTGSVYLAKFAKAGGFTYQDSLWTINDSGYISPVIHPGYYLNDDPNNQPVKGFDGLSCQNTAGKPTYILYYISSYQAGQKDISNNYDYCKTYADAINADLAKLVKIGGNFRSASASSSAPVSSGSRIRPYTEISMNLQ